MNPQESMEMVEALRRKIGTPRTGKEMAAFADTLLMSEAVDSALFELHSKASQVGDQTEVIIHPGDEWNPRVVVLNWREHDATDIHTHYAPFAFYVYGGSVIEEIYAHGALPGTPPYVIATREYHGETMTASGPAMHRLRGGSNPNLPNAVTLHVRMLSPAEREYDPETGRDPHHVPFKRSRP